MTILPEYRLSYSTPLKMSSKLPMQLLIPWFCSQWPRTTTCFDGLSDGGFAGSLVNIRLDVIHILDADRQPQQAVGDAESRGQSLNSELDPTTFIILTIQALTFIDSDPHCFP